MTRINSAIDPKLLTDEHLLAEHREIKRVCTYANKTYPNAPKEFVLGSGHVIFFADKPVFTLKRYLSLYQECILRGFYVEDYHLNWNKYNFTSNTPEYTPTNKERDLLIQRILDRILTSKKKYWHYYKNKITKQQAINLILTGNYEK